MFCQFRPRSKLAEVRAVPGYVGGMLRARRLWVAVVAIGILAASCTVSRVDPKANIEIDGTVQREGGRPVAGARVVLLREGDVGDVLLTITTLGTACLSPRDAPAICHNGRMRTTGSTGGFRYTLKGSETQSTFGFSAVLNLTTGLDAKPDEVSGSSTTYRFHVQTTALNLPLRLWEPGLSARTGSFGARVSFPALPGALIPRPLRAAPHYSIDFARGSENVWTFTDVRPTTTFDPRLLEDSQGTVRVSAAAHDIHASAQLGDDIAYILNGGSHGYESPVGPPTSRGKTCSVFDSKGKSYPLSPCGLSDGEFGQKINPPNVCSGKTSCTQPSFAGVVEDIGTVIPADLIVLRGCNISCRVETSADGRSWRAAGVAEDAEAALPLATRQTRYVRVLTSFVGELTELSVWSVKPSLPDGSFLIAPPTFPTSSNSGRPHTSSSGGRHFGWYVVVAALLLGGVAGAAAMLVARDRKRGTFKA